MIKRIWIGICLFFTAAVGVLWWLIVPVAIWEGHCSGSQPFCDPAPYHVYLSYFEWIFFWGPSDGWMKQHYVLAPLVAFALMGYVILLLGSLVFGWLVIPYFLGSVFGAGTEARNLENKPCTKEPAPKRSAG